MKAEEKFLEEKRSIKKYLPVYISVLLINAVFVGLYIKFAFSYIYSDIFDLLLSRWGIIGILFMFFPSYIVIGSAVKRYRQAKRNYEKYKDE